MQYYSSSNWKIWVQLVSNPTGRYAILQFRQLENMGMTTGLQPNGKICNTTVPASGKYGYDNWSLTLREDIQYYSSSNWIVWV
jgi:hypothetical protein